jgi:hypothetical protein
VVTFGESGAARRIKRGCEEQQSADHAKAHPACALVTVSLEKQALPEGGRRRVEHIRRGDTRATRAALALVGG